MSTVTASPDETRTNLEPFAGRDANERSIGTMLVDLGLINMRELEAIQHYAAERRLKFGEAAVMLNFLKPQDIESAFGRQHSYSLMPRGGAGGVSDEVVAAYSPQTDGVEAMRALRSRITVGWLKHAQRRLLPIVSSARGEGRSWMAANLATLFAQAGYRTLLIDADMRRPRQHELFNIDNSAGLSSVLAGRAGHDIVYRVHEQLRLFVLPAGSVPCNPQELLAGPVFNALIDNYAAQFDVILIDTPAVEESADAQLVASHAGAALMLVHRNHTGKKALTDAIKDIKDAGARVIASVVVDH